MTENTQAGAFTGRKRDRRPKASVKVVDRIAQSLITVGGLGSILAVSMVGVFLVWVAAPLAESGAALPGEPDTCYRVTSRG